MRQKSGITYTDFFSDRRSQEDQKAWLRHWPVPAHRKCAGVPHADDGLPRKAKAGWTVMSGAVLSSTASSQRDPGRDPAGNLLAAFNLAHQLQTEKC